MRRSVRKTSFPAISTSHISFLSFKGLFSQSCPVRSFPEVTHWSTLATAKPSLELSIKGNFPPAALSPAAQAAQALHQHCDGDCSTHTVLGRFLAFSCRQLYLGGVSTMETRIYFSILISLNENQAPGDLGFFLLFLKAQTELILPQTVLLT